ncbi:unnamed protein product, partial [Medioppia subpectinata]
MIISLVITSLTITSLSPVYGADFCQAFVDNNNAIDFAYSNPSAGRDYNSFLFIGRDYWHVLVEGLGPTGQLTSVRITAQTASVVLDWFPHEKYSMAFAIPYGTGKQEWITGLIYHKSSIDWMAMNLKGYELEKKNSGDQWKNGSIDFGQDFDPSLAFYASIVGHDVNDVCFAAQTSVSKGSYRREYRCYEFDDQLKPTISTDRVIKGIQSKMTADNDPKAAQPLTSLTSPETNRPLMAVFVFNLFDTNKTLITHYLFLYNEEKVVSYCHSNNSLFHLECQHPDNYTVYANCSQYKAKPTTSPPSRPTSTTNPSTSTPKSTVGGNKSVLVIVIIVVLVIVVAIIGVIVIACS